MAFMVKSGNYYLSDVARHNNIFNLITSDLKPQVVKLNGEVMEDVGEFLTLIAHLRTLPLTAEKFGADIKVMEIKEEKQWRILIGQ